MDEFNKPIQPIGSEDQKKVYLTRIGEDKYEREKQAYKEIEKQKTKGVVAFVLVFFKKLFGTLRNVETKSTPLPTTDALVQDLEALRVLLKQLTERDQSENSDFATRLSEVWVRLAQHAELIQSGQLCSIVNGHALEKLLNQMGLFPFHGDHLLGYYLKEQAGKDWLPFPFMELLKKLHRDYHNQPELSDLQEWLTEIHQLLPKTE